MILRSSLNQSPVDYIRYLTAVLIFSLVSAAGSRLTRAYMVTWAEVTDQSGSAEATVREFILPALGAIPESLSSRLGACRVSLVRSLPGATSRWTRSGNDLNVEVATEDLEPHDVALEMLLCLGQAIWDVAAPEQRAAWLKVLEAEFDAKAEGEIDEEALAEKRRLLASRTLARSPRRLLRYAGAAFAGTLAEYVHALWHDVTVRIGPEYLPPEWLRTRLQFFERWFPPEGGRRLFPE